MKKSRFTEPQIIKALKEHEACECDTDKLPYEKNYFDAVICTYC